MPAAEDQRNIASKQEHTHEVCLHAVRIAKDLHLDDRVMFLAETAALLHDVGRFSQYQQYRTFVDSISVNHAARGARVLIENRVLNDLPKRDQTIIIRAVTLHNVFVLPEGLDEETLLVVRIVRDADKLDILRVVMDYLASDAGSRAEAVALGLPDVPGYSEEVLGALRRGEMAKKSFLTTLNDFKLLQLAWMYDLNFASSLRLVVERRYIDRIAATLPQTEDIAVAVDTVRSYVHNRLHQG